VITATKLIFVLVVTGISASLSAHSKPQDCTQGCLIKIEGLQDTYWPGSRADLKIHNRSKQTLNVNVAVEGLESGSWVEVVGSVSDPKHSMSQILILSPIKAGAPLAITFHPCETPIIVKTGDSLGVSDHPCAKPSAGVAMPTALRLRVDVHVKGQEGISQRVRSQEFRLTAGK
jgi:hypothetical protein